MGSGSSAVVTQSMELRSADNLVADTRAIKFRAVGGVLTQKERFWDLAPSGVTGHPDEDRRMPQ